MCTSLIYWFRQNPKRLVWPKHNRSTSLSAINWRLRRAHIHMHKGNTHLNIYTYASREYSIIWILQQWHVVILMNDDHMVRWGERLQWIVYDFLPQVSVRWTRFLGTYRRFSQVDILLERVESNGFLSFIDRVINRRGNCMFFRAPRIRLAHGDKTTPGSCLRSVWQKKKMPPMTSICLYSIRYIYYRILLFARIILHRTQCARVAFRRWIIILEVENVVRNYCNSMSFKILMFIKKKILSWFHNNIIAGDRFKYQKSKLWAKYVMCVL